VKKKKTVIALIFAIVSLPILSSHNDLLYGVCSMLEIQIRDYCEEGLVDQCRQVISDYNYQGCDDVLITTQPQ